MLLIVAPEYAEVEYLLAQTTVLGTEIIGNITLYTVQLGTISFLVLVCGFGKVNIARALATVCERKDVSALLCIGTAGAVVCCECLPTAVVAKNSLQYDVDFSCFGKSCATLPNMSTGVFASDTSMTALALSAAAATGVCASLATVATADRFLQNDSLRNSLRTTYCADAADAECGAAAQTAELLNIPFTAIKVLCNRAGCNACEEYKKYSPQAVLLAQKIALNYISLA